MAGDLGYTNIFNTSEISHYLDSHFKINKKRVRIRRSEKDIKRRLKRKRCGNIIIEYITYRVSILLQS